VCVCVCSFCYDVWVDAVSHNNTNAKAEGFSVDHCIITR